MSKILSVYNRLQTGDYENGNGSKRRVSRLTQFMHTTLQLRFDVVQCIATLELASSLKVELCSSVNPSCRYGRCPEIPEILKVFLKFSSFPEFFADVL